MNGSNKIDYLKTKNFENYQFFGYFRFDLNLNIIIE